MAFSARHAACNKPKAQAPRRASEVVSDRAPAAKNRHWLPLRMNVCPLRIRRRFTTARLAQKYRANLSMQGEKLREVYDDGHTHNSTKFF